MGQSLGTLELQRVKLTQKDTRAGRGGGTAKLTNVIVLVVLTYTTWDSVGKRCSEGVYHFKKPQWKYDHSVLIL